MRNILVLTSFALLAAPLAALQTPTTGVGAAKATQSKESPPPSARSPPWRSRFRRRSSWWRSATRPAAIDKLRAIAEGSRRDSPRALPGGRPLRAAQQAAGGPGGAQAAGGPEDAQPAVLYNAGQAALMAGQVDVGRVYLTRSVIKEPASPAARELGMLTARQGHVVEAYSMLRPWVLRNPSDAEARLVAANLAVQLERADDATQLLSGMSDSDPAIRLLRGKALVLKKDGPGAVALLSPLVANHPQGMDLEVRRSLAEAQLLAGKPAEAIKLIDGKTAGRPALVLLLARAQRQAGNAAAAAAALKPLADKLPANANAIGDPRPAAGIAMEYGALLVDAGKRRRGGAVLPEVDRATTRATPTPGRGSPGRSTPPAASRKPRRRWPRRSSWPSPRARRLRRGPGPAQSGAQAAAAPAEQPLSAGLQKAIELMGQGQLEPALTAVRQEIAVSKDPRARMIEVRLLLGLKRPEEALKAADTALADCPEQPRLCLPPWGVADGPAAPQLGRAGPPQDPAAPAPAPAGDGRSRGAAAALEQEGRGPQAPPAGAADQPAGQGGRRQPGAAERGGAAVG